MGFKQIQFGSGGYENASAAPTSVTSSVGATAAKQVCFKKEIAIINSLFGHHKLVTRRSIAMHCSKTFHFICNLFGDKTFH